MKRPLGLTYAAVPGRGAQPACRPGAWRRLRVQTRGAWVEPRPVLGRAGRWVVGSLLVVLSLAVLGKEPALRETVLRQAGGWWERLTAAPAAPRSAEEPVRGAEFLPLALVSDGGLFVLGADGRLEPAGAQALADRLPIVTGVPVREVPDQMRVRLEAPVDVALVRRVLAGTGSADLSEINLEDPQGVVLYTRDSVKVKLERGPGLERDLRRLAAVRADLRRRGTAAAVIDLRYLQQAVVKPRARRSDD
jgi:hypothetical protein